MALFDFGDFLDKLEKIGKAWEFIVAAGAAAGGGLLWVNRKRKARRERRRRLVMIADQYDTIIAKLGKLDGIEATVGENTLNISGISALVSGFTDDMQKKLNKQREEFDDRVDKFEKNFRDEIKDLRGDLFDLARDSRQ